MRDLRLSGAGASAGNELPAFLPAGTESPIELARCLSERDTASLDCDRLITLRGGVMGALAAARPPSAGFGLRFLGEAGGRLAERKVPLADAWSTRFERVRPVREFPSYPGRRGFSGQWWSSTMRDLVGFESWLERDRVMVLDFSPEVVAFSSQPFWLTWQAGARIRRHAPDYFARLADGTGLVIDVRADDDIEPKDAEALAATEEACQSVGWAYQRVGAVDPVLAANLRWLSDYKHPRTGAGTRTSSA